MADLPPMKIICRSSDATNIFTGPPAVGRAGELLSGSSAMVAFSNDGVWMCAVGRETADLVTTHTMQQVRSLPIGDILHVGFSPKATYLITCQRPMKSVGVSNKNLQVWEVATGKLCWEFHQRQVSEESWPAIHWDENEGYAFHMVKNTIHAYDPVQGFRGAVCKLPLPGVAGFTISPGAKAKIAAYVAESKGQPATIGIFPVSDLPRDQTTEPKMTNRKSMYRVSGVTFIWNSTGSAVLCNSYSDVDVSNQSYYGEQHLYFMDGNAEEAALVPVEKGPIHDIQWSPKGDFFAVVAGFMPAKTMLFNAKCKPIFDLGNGPHNMIRWNPQGRFLCVAGFGNLPGDIVFWDKKNNGSCRRITTVRCPSVTMEWSPCGRHILTAITAPRLRVDNAFKVYTYYGELVHHETFKELYEAQWVPAPADQYPDRPPSPGRVGGSVNSAPAAQEAQASAYVPPHLRGRSTRSSAAQFSLGHSTDQGGRVKSEQQQQRKEPDVPGASFVGKAATKNAKRRAKKASQKQGDGNDNGEQGAPANQQGTEGSGHNRSPSVKQVTEGVAEVNVAAGGGSEEAQKKIRNLKKKLRQIDTLKEKMATSGKDSLAKEQLEKLAGEVSIRQELRALGDSG
ncbi:hypothetical protein BSKO_13014 [Bryopsis sp. KO-2023]|nr:hypothetical protein BSKO_13014 [Bryopsis sp. KO-2023]